jgi:L-histidine N-alpha-methyltransferase
MLSDEDCLFSDTRTKLSNFLPEINRQSTINFIFEGLTSAPKRISSVFFYDANGSKLFEQITNLPEYYLTKIERELIRCFAASMCSELCYTDIIELGSGDCSKISIILDSIGNENLNTVCYKPLDISINALKESAEILNKKYPQLSVHCIAADFISQLHLVPSERKNLFCFFGSTIGNLSFEQRNCLLKKIAVQMNQGDTLLIGIDMVKPKEVLERAYNDKSNVTALFNRNILNVVNSITGTNFDQQSFEHLAFYNETESRMEMHLKALKTMIIESESSGFKINIDNEELIHTENSHKFTITQIGRHIEEAGLKIERIFSDDRNWFSLVQISK